MAQGQNEPSPACDALTRFRAELASGRVSVRPDPLDIEYVAMKLALLERLPPQAAGGAVVTPTLARLTLTAAEVIADQLEVRP